jgi:DNA-directed RNA polymerase subunit RPC12/RpoP
MPIVKLRLPEIEKHQDDRPQRCPYCNSPVLQRWGRISKSVTDKGEQVTGGYRYRCCECQRTFRGYPAEVDRSNQSKRIRRLAAIAIALGMSSREAADLFAKLGITLSHTTIWRDGRELRAQFNGHTKKLKRYTLDTNYIHRISNKLGVVIVLELWQGEYRVLGTVDEYNPRTVKSWLESMVKGFNIEVSLHGTGVLHEQHCNIGALPQPAFG